MRDSFYIWGFYQKEIREIKKAAEKFDIRLSIHAPYWLNLNSKEKKKIKESKDRILQCCRIGELIGAYKVVFHAGFYGGMEKEECYQNIKKAVLEMMNVIKKKHWKIKLAPETMGKINVFGSDDEILRLARETGCSFCLDFAHLYARSLGKISYEEIYEKFRQFQSLHCHFSGINFGDKGEKSHKLTPDSEIKRLLGALPKNKDITIISESPDPIGDALKMQRIVEKSR
jgi:deoxyribonuclease-4